MTKVESEPIDQNNNQNDEKRKRDFKLRPKVFTVQDSLLRWVDKALDKPVIEVPNSIKLIPFDNNP